MRRRACVAVLAIAAVSGCTTPDTAPVPDVADAPFVCDGVPERGMELTLGGKVTAEQTGSWRADGPAFSCAVDGGAGRVLVTYGDPTTFLSLDDASQQGGAEPLELDADGAGYLFGGAAPTAMWVCGDRVLAVETFDVDTRGREASDDARNLLASMLPWACDGEDAPDAA